MTAAPDRAVSIEFRRFTVVRHRRELFVDGRAVELGGRAFDTLITLIDARGSIVDKDALMQRVWPDRVVEENNLQAQISTLRKMFGGDRDLIRTVAGRGYQFTGEIRDAGMPRDAVPARLTNLPVLQSELIGRDGPLGAVTALVTAHRLVTLTGTGGVGKTRLALEDRPALERARGREE
jgi:DNA-binding winged helix-turn-helix (wHTH) protein